MTERFRINANAYARLIDAMLEGPCTYAELSEATGLHDHTVRTYVKAMLRVRPRRVARIAEWHEDSLGRRQVPAFAIGRGKDAPKQTKTAAQRAKAYRVRKRQAEQMMVVAGLGRFEQAANGRLRFVKVA